MNNKKISDLDKLLFTEAAQIYPEFREKILHLGADVNANFNGYTPLAFAFPPYSAFSFPPNTSDETISPYVEFLILNGADVNSKTAYGHTPILELVRWDNVESTIKLLIEKGADIHAVDDNGMGALHIACSGNIKFLIDLGLDVNLAAKDGRTPICLQANDSNAFRLLLDAGADLNKTPTSLFFFTKGNLKITELLLDEGLDPNTRNSYDQLAIEVLAREDNDFDIKDSKKIDKRKELLMKILEKTRFSDKP